MTNSARILSVIGFRKQEKANDTEPQRPPPLPLDHLTIRISATQDGYIVTIPDGYLDQNRFYQSVKKYPDFFKKFGVQTTEKIELILPSVQKLNRLIKELREKNDPDASTLGFWEDFSKRQTPEREFIEGLLQENPRVPISILGFTEREGILFYHDWFAHFFGYVAIPNLLMRQIQAELHFSEAVEKNPILKNHGGLIETLTFKKSRVLELLDNGTGTLGTALLQGSEEQVFMSLLTLQSIGITNFRHSLLKSVWGSSIRNTMSPIELQELTRMLDLYSKPFEDMPTGTNLVHQEVQKLKARFKF